VPEEPEHKYSWWRLKQSIEKVTLTKLKQELTFIVVSSITTALFQSDTAVSSIPAIVTATFPCTIAVDSTLTVSTTAVWTAFHSTMTTIPARHTQACTIFTLPMLITPAIPCNSVRYYRKLYKTAHLYSVIKTLFFTSCCVMESRYKVAIVKMDPF
jgi:hypothetical protein